jgi:hypothetical protein
MTLTAELLASLDTVFHETTTMLRALDERGTAIDSDSDRREAKRRVFEIRGKTQELFEWLSNARLEEPKN